jgi:polyhydroxybutyrate depolymerase
MRWLTPYAAVVLALATTSARAVLPPGETTRTLEHGGLTRSYYLHVPPSYDGATAVPLVLDFHGFGSNAFQQRAISGMSAVSDREGFLLVHPEGVDDEWNAGLCCGGGMLDDVGFIRAVVAAVSADGNVDASRIYATGLSNGGAISHRLACEAADLFAAVAPMAFPVPFRPLSECRPVRPIPVLTFMGLVDVLVRYDGGRFPSAFQTLHYWLGMNGCTLIPDVVVTQDDSRCETHTQCAAGVETGLCSITAATFGGQYFDGHILYINDDFVLADVAWAFLSRFRLPDTPATFRRATLTGTTRAKLRGQAPITADASWEFALGSGTWWAEDGAGRPFAGAVRGKHRRVLGLANDGTQLADLIAETLGTAPGITYNPDRLFRISLGRRRVRLTGTVTLLGPPASGTFRVKLAGRLAE